MDRLVFKPQIGDTESFRSSFSDSEFHGSMVQRGAPGKDGFSPIAKAERFDGYAKITVTDKKGTTSAEIYDGNVEEVEVLTNMEIEQLLNGFV